MELEERINDDIKQAMRAKDTQRLSALRAVKASILLAKTEKGSGGSEVSDEAGMKILQKQVKQRKESAELYIAQGREDLAKEEIFQASVIEAYLPKQLSENEIRVQVGEIIEQTGASTMKDMGKVMGLASKALAGKADNRLVSTIVRELLGS